MVYSASFSITLGSSQTGLTLEAQIKDTAGVNVGAAITAGFVEIGVGNYMFTGTAIPDGHRGGVVFQVSPAGAIKAFAAINPEELEFTNVKTSRVFQDGVVLAETPVGAPPVTPTPEQFAARLYQALVSKIQTTSGESRYFQLGGTQITKRAVSDASGVFTRNNQVAP